MTKRFPYLFFLTLSICLICFSCQNHDDAPMKNQLVEIAGSNYSQYYTYDNDRLSTFKISSDAKTYTKFNYDGDRLVSVEVISSDVVASRIELTYDDKGKRVSEIEYRFPASGQKEVYSTNTYAYDDAGNVILKTLSPAKDNAGQPATFHFEFEYQWQAGNVTRNDRYLVYDDKRQLYSTYNYTYDNKHNPAKQNMVFAYVGGFEEVLSLNNIISTELIQDGVPQYNAPTIFVYNNQDYPDRSAYTQIDANASTIIQRQYKYQ
ncbi:hypothetical protein SAMN04488109_4424 [Chryseolinea serpens]|uniref:YD repeat-containing protein n=1 Tax=Chryseolinea serpens TaxID=947013 RepID=A0A1M5U315_9BACT|nr:hypothetical protein [Chryseolinea serpens]SHH57251.1 hypothetical protein SAMN04488109_4424 [Chryseolinea serpens]